ncbi:hypothetical protein B0H17DRAFT_924330 [Mycena rosella]|uniref:Uncharacterized protein n=1 Tax=Mycena rosella TaxID=1033263 RepID=A0AAD7GMD8_MYCRO|nr:hypothetical protein B0H17DRAFT_924330 [Mycena rosella]
MWGIAFRVRTTRGRAYSSRSNKITDYLRDLSSVTRDPIWRLVMALHSPQRLSILEALDASHVPLDDFSHWRAFLYASDIDAAMENTPTRSHPSWLVLYLAAFKVRTSQHAAGSLMDLSFTHLDAAPPAVQAPLLVLTMMHLARFDLLSPMQRVIDAFLLVPLPQPQNVHFNHLLAAMTAIRHRSSETGENAVKVLRAMETRQLHLWPRTCSKLLEDRYAALQLTAYLRRRTTALGVVPSASQLEAYLRVYAANGAIHDARAYAAAIRGFRRTEGTAEEQASAHAHSVNRAGTLLVRSQPDSASAFQFLTGLVAKTTREGPFRPRPHPSTHPRALLGKRGVDIYDWTAALSVAAHDRTVDAKSLLRLFRRTRPPAAEFRATAASRTVLIRGLLLRREWELAYTVWTRLATSGLPIDEPALAAGLQAATLARRPAEAFALLEKYAARPGALPSATYRLLRPVRITTGLVNALMTALHRILRPDLVFRLWDAMDALYGVRPSPETLRILLAAAQLPHTLDDSFHGQIALLALKNPFRPAAAAAAAPPPPRAALAQSLAALAAAPYRSGVWRARPATHTASHIFLQAALGAPEHRHVAALPPPAHAVRPHAESDSAAPTLRLDMPVAPFVLPLDVPAPGGVAVRAREWHAYVLLLGMTRRAPELARALAWMRALGVRPGARTLGVALAFWGEVSVQPPLIAALAGARGDEYAKLVAWLGEWCARVPDEEAVGRWRGRIARVRAQRRQMAGMERFVEEEHIWADRDLEYKRHE